jgi:putative ATP-dependent endonuclease of OLD family
MWKIVEALPVQRLITTYSGDFLSLVGLTDIRRLERRNGEVFVYGLGDRDLTDDERRRVSYHIRARRGSALFARAWLLVEGETEAWLMPELARTMGYDLMSEGVSLIEFAQAGLGALLRAANGWGIEWHLLADGDRAGDEYVQAARFHLNGRAESECFTQLPEADMERHLWHEGFQDVYRRAAGRAGRLAPAGRTEADVARVISKAIEKSAKPWLALQVADELWRTHGTNTPMLLAQCVQAVVRLARSQDSFAPEAA